MSNLFDLSGKVVAVTGGYGYLGKAICEGLAEHKATVYVCGKDEDKFDLAFPAGNMIHFNKCDVADTTSIRASLAAIDAEHGRIDVLINNAFYCKGSDPLGITDEDWAYSIDGTINSAYRCIREAVPYLAKSPTGKIINVASMYGVVAPDFSLYEDAPASLNPPHYGIAKAGIIQLTKYFASYLGSRGILVNTVTPGPFPSPQVQLQEKFIRGLKERTVLGRIGQPDDLKGAFVFLASDASAFITGQNIVVDGGWTIK